MKNRFENVTIILKNGDKEFCNVVTIVDEGIYTGFINSKQEDRNCVIDTRFIPRGQIQRILISNKTGKDEDIEF